MKKFAIGMLVLTLGSFVYASDFSKIANVGNGAEGQKMLAKVTAEEAAKLAWSLGSTSPRINFADDCATALGGSEKDVEKKIDVALHQGFSCMAKLGSDTNLERLKRAYSLFTDSAHSINVHCAMSSNSERAPASAPSAAGNTRAVFLPPSALKSDSDLPIGRTAFREFFALWDEASETSDSATACQICCFPPKAAAGQTARVREGQVIGCNLCSGKIPTSNMLGYQEAIFNMLDKAGNTSSFSYINDNLLKKAPTSARLRFRLAEAATEDNANLAPVGMAMMEYLVSVYPRPTTERFAHLVTLVQSRRQNDPTPQTLAVLGKAAHFLSEAYFRNLDGDWRGALTSLRQIRWPAVEQYHDRSIQTISVRYRNQMLLLAYEILSEASTAGLTEVKVLMKEGRPQEAENLAFEHLQVAGELLKRYRPMAQQVAETPPVTPAPVVATPKKIKVAPRS